MDLREIVFSHQCKHFFDSSYKWRVLTKIYIFASLKIIDWSNHTWRYWMTFWRNYNRQFRRNSRRYMYFRRREREWRRWCTEVKYMQMVNSQKRWTLMVGIHLKKMHIHEWEKSCVEWKKCLNTYSKKFILRTPHWDYQFQSCKIIIWKQCLIYLQCLTWVMVSQTWMTGWSTVNSWF